MLPTARTASLVVERLGDEVVVFDALANRAHTLNRTAALVFGHADGRTPVATIAARVAAELGAEADEGVVTLALDQLGRAGLLEDGAPAGRAMTRRDAMRRLGVAGAAAALLPLVRTIAAPTPAMAASPGNGSGNGGGACANGGGAIGTPCSSNADCCAPLTCVESDPGSPKTCQLDF
jgi:hypothetical protein